MAANAGRLIGFFAGFGLLRVGMRFPRLFRPGPGLRLAPLEVFTECRSQPGFLGRISGVELFIHKIPLSRADRRFKLCLRGADPYGKPCPRGAVRPRFDPGLLP
jgi:hypothetical protein